MMVADLEVHLVEFVGEVLRLVSGLMILLVALTTLATFWTGTTLATVTTITSVATLTTLWTLTALATFTGGTLLIAFGFLNEYTVRELELTSLRINL